MSFSVEVWGDYACFTRPEMKVERVSYDVMTPSAARGILDAIYWNPGIKWCIDQIHVCAPICFVNIRRNEVSSVISEKKVKSFMQKGTVDLYLATSDCVQQRSSLVLKDVHYVIEAHFELTRHMKCGENSGKFSHIINRRLSSGQYFHQPYLGMREFAASFAPCTKIPACPNELKGERDLGWMLWDMDYSNTENIDPIFFRVVMKDGIIRVPTIKKEMDSRCDIGSIK